MRAKVKNAKEVDFQNSFTVDSSLVEEDSEISVQVQQDKKGVRSVKSLGKPFKKMLTGVKEID